MSLPGGTLVQRHTPPDLMSRDELALGDDGDGGLGSMIAATVGLFLDDTVERTTDGL